MKNLNWILSLFLMVFFVSTAFTSEMSPEKAKYYQAVESAKAAFESGRVISDSQRQLLKAEGLIRDPSQGTYDELDRSGGPDDFGYSFIDSDEENGPEYDWVDISDTGTDCGVNNDDHNVGPFDIDFDFPFYGDIYDQFWVCSNGWISLATGQGQAYSNLAIPSTAAPNYMIAPFWDDLYPPGGGEVYYEGDETQMVIQYDDCRHISFNDSVITCQVILYPNGEIILQYEELTIPDNSNTIGIENSSGTIGLSINYNQGNYPFEELAIRIFLPDPDASVSGTVTDAVTGAAIAGANVRISQWTDVTDGNGNYSIDETYSGLDLDVGVSVDGYFLFLDQVLLDEGENTYDVEMDPLPPPQDETYEEDFEDDRGFFMTAGSARLWEWGEPSLQPGDAHSGDFAWATNIGGNYGLTDRDTLFTATTWDISTPDAFVGYWHWYYILDINDGYNFWISIDDRDTWDLLEPVDDYTDENGNIDNGNQPCFNGTTGDSQWVYIGYDLSEYEGETAWFMFNFTSNARTSYAGVTFDDFTVYLDPSDASVSGTVIDSETEDPLDSVIVHFDNIDNILDFDAMTDTSGNYSIEDIHSGNYTITIEHEGYFEYLMEDTVIEAGDNTIDLEIDILSGPLTGVIADEMTEELLIGATIQCFDPANMDEVYREVQTNELGEYTALALHDGVRYLVVASANGYANSDTATVTIRYNRENVRDFELTPIFTRDNEYLQTQQDTETWVLTSGIVTQGTNVTDTAHTNIYIQDDSDWGIQVWDDAPWNAEAEIVRGDSVEIVGYLIEVDDITRITNFEIEVISSDHQLPEPLVEPTGDMSTNGQREGTWAQVNGQINRDPGDGTYTLVVNDGSGQCEVQISGTANLDLSAFSANDWGTFTGVISLSRQGLRLIPNDQADIERININAPSDLTSEQEVVPGDPLQLDVTLSWAHDHLDDFIRFKIYRDDEHIGNTQQNSWNEKIEDPNPGEFASYTYVYAVTAIYDEGETPESNEVEVIWDITLVHERPYSGIPTEWALEAVYPNPFNPTLHVILGVPQTSNVTAEIIDILGRRVNVLHNGELGAAYHRFGWNATGNPTGLYFLKITTNAGFAEVRKLMFIK
ncbi:MAG: carboxypeptidase regulatory-like domain-containing protein [Candidatus Electryonea clarkiae]|nr:carboxypeptidase regulatory-like domain-containing protein [Candidatus Electryonea clarkiae]MDP8286507.1 carboxypeptidase regulatory-like domain-containing protein [Candidatus Electryonea clarkiae]